MTTPLPFCKTCSNLLPSTPALKSTAPIICPLCHTPNPPPPTTTLTTTSKPSAFPSTLRTRLRSDVQALEEAAAAGGTEAMIQQTCEKCGCENVRYHEVQLRSADEGSTVFYTCPVCGWKWNTNN